MLDLWFLSRALSSVSRHRCPNFFLFEFFFGREHFSFELFLGVRPWLRIVLRTLSVPLLFGAFWVAVLPPFGRTTPSLGDGAPKGRCATYAVFAEVCFTGFFSRFASWLAESVRPLRRSRGTGTSWRASCSSTPFAGSTHGSVFLMLFP